MKKLAILTLVVAAVSFILGVISKVMLQPFSILPGGVTADNFLNFTDTCLLAAIVFALLHIARK